MASAELALVPGTVNCPVAGSHISVGRTGDVDVSKPPALLPPTIRTFPSGRITALCCRRGKCMLPVNFQAGVAAFKSIVSAVAVGGSDPPTMATLPGEYITAGP